MIDELRTLEVEAVGEIRADEIGERRGARRRDAQIAFDRELPVQALAACGLDQEIALAERATVRSQRQIRGDEPQRRRMADEKAEQTLGITAEADRARRRA